ncbi:hypothetical protein CHUAL_007101 [Chamberlinius hualienensis]
MRWFVIFKAAFVALLSVVSVKWVIVDFLFSESLGNKFNSKVISGQKVIITGASTGIGEQLAYAYSRLGARVMITARREDVLRAVGSHCEKLGAKQVIVVPGDMAIAEDREHLVSMAREKFNGELDQLILNHVYVRQGRWLGSSANITTIRNTFEVNFFSYMEIASHTIDMLIKANGSIGVMSSVAGKVPQAGFAFYAATKFALDGFFSSWRIELELSGANVSLTNSILGLIATDSAMDSIREGLVKISPDQAASVEETAEFIMQGVTLRKREIYFPFNAKLICQTYKFFPSYVEKDCAQYTY